MSTSAASVFASDSDVLALAAHVVRKIGVGPTPADASQDDDDCLFEFEHASVSDQVQACALAAMMSTCAYCYDGLTRLQSLFYFLDEQTRLCHSATLRGALPVVRNFFCVYEKLRVTCDKERAQRSMHANACRALLSLLVHADEDVTESAVPGDLASAVSLTIDDGNREAIQDVYRGVDRVISSDDMVACTAVLRHVLLNARNRDVDWLILFVDRAASMGRFHHLSEDVRYLPLYVSSVIKSCGGCHEMIPELKHFICAFLGRLCASPLASIISDKSPYSRRSTKTCPMHADNCCARRASSDIDKFLEKIRNAQSRSNGEITFRAAGGDRKFCCSQSKSDEIPDTFKEWWTFIVDLVEDSARIGKTRLRKRASPESESTPKPVDCDERAHKRRRDGETKRLYLPQIFSGPIIGADSIDNTKRSFAVRAPRTLMCTLLNTLDERNAKSNDPVLVRGPYYRSISNGVMQITNAYSAVRLSVYANHLKRRWHMQCLDALPFCEMVRGPVPVGHVRARTEEEREAWSAVKSLVHSPLYGTDISDTVDPASDACIPIHPADQALCLSARMNSSALFEGVPSRDRDGAFPVWMVASDPCGDYRHWPWIARVSPSLGDTLPCVRPNIEAHKDMNRCRKPMYINLLDMSRGTENAHFYDAERLYLTYLTDREKYGVNMLRLYMYLVHRSLFGVMTKMNKHNALVRYEPDGTAHFLPCQDFVHKWPRCPEFDSTKRYDVANLAPTKLPHTPPRFPQRRRRARDKSVREIRAERIASAKERVDNVIRPLLRFIMKIDKCKELYDTCEDTKERAELAAHAREFFNKAKKLSCKLSEKRSTQGLNIDDVMLRSCMSVPTVCHLEWYSVAGTLGYMGSRVLSLEPGAWGTIPSYFARIENHDPESNKYRTYAPNAQIFQQWMISLANDTPIPYDVMKQMYPKENMVAVKDTHGWLVTHPDNFVEVENVMTQWCDAISDELKEQRTLVDAHKQRISEIRARYKRGGQPWIREIYDMYSARDALAQDAYQSHKSTAHVLSDGTLFWDPDLAPDPMWLAHCYLPELLRCAERYVRMYRDVRRNDADAWFDLLEFTHGRLALERFVGKIENSLKQAMKKVVIPRTNRFFLNLPK